MTKMIIVQLANIGLYESMESIDHDHRVDG